MKRRIRILLCMGARPNFMKVAPLVKTYRASEHLQEIFDLQLVHAGQHSSEEMSEVFLRQLGILPIDHRLPKIPVGSGDVTAKIMIGFEKLCRRLEPDLCLVVGDVNATLACAIVAKKLQISLGHIEAGLRSFDRTMPEEINRLAVDAISDAYFTTSPTAAAQLIHEGVEHRRIHVVGNLMIDNLLDFYSSAKQSELVFSGRTLKPQSFALATLHRPSNVDDPKRLQSWLSRLRDVSQTIPTLLILHPRTKFVIRRHKLKLGRRTNLICIDPVDFQHMVTIYRNALFAMTDSGGVQEETTAIGLPCLTLRQNTERPETVTHGSNIVVGDNHELLKEMVAKIMSGNFQARGVPELWDGRTASRIWQVLGERFARNLPEGGSGVDLAG